MKIMVAAADHVDSKDYGQAGRVVLRWCGSFFHHTRTYEPRHEETGFLHMRKQRRRSANQRLCFRYIDSTIPLLSKSEISSL